MEKHSIKWFQSITNKNNCRFIKFDVSEFYPTISEELLEKSINFAKNMINIDANKIRIIKHAPKSLLFDSTGVWVKNEDNPLFDVTMGNFDEAEVCEIVTTNLVETEFRDVTFNLSTGKYYPYIKLNSAPLYIHAMSNHHPSIVKQLRKMVNERISDFPLMKAHLIMQKK